MVPAKSVEAPVAGSRGRCEAAPNVQRSYCPRFWLPPRVRRTIHALSCGQERQRSDRPARQQQPVGLGCHPCHRWTVTTIYDAVFPGRSLGGGSTSGAEQLLTEHLAPYASGIVRVPLSAIPLEPIRFRSGGVLPDSRLDDATNRRGATWNNSSTCLTSEHSTQPALTAPGSAELPGVLG